LCERPFISFCFLLASGFCDGFHLSCHTRFVLFINSPKSFASFVVAKQDALASGSIHVWAYSSLRNVVLCFEKMILHSSMVTALCRIADHLSLNKPTATRHPLLKHQSHLKDIRPTIMPKVSSVGAIVIESRCYLEIHPTRSTPEHSRPHSSPCRYCACIMLTRCRYGYPYIGQLHQQAAGNITAGSRDCNF
jgi:hypothetical protein